MSRTILCLAALVVAAAAWPSNNFVKVDRFSTNALCVAAGTPAGTDYYAIDLCAVSSSSSYKYTMPDTMTISYWTYSSSTTCAGAGIWVRNVTIGSCGSTSMYKATSLSTSVGLWSTTSYSDSSCGTLSDGPTFANGGCNSGTQVTVGGKLELCVGSATDCSGDSQCFTISDKGGCNAVQSNSGANNGGVAYDWNAASSATPAVALTAALIAVVAAVTKF